MSRYEKIVLLLTAVFVAGCIGIFAFDGGRQNYTVTVERDAPPVQTGVQQEDDRPDSLLSGERIDLNTAPEKDLARLPGIGESRAADIVAYRQEYGPFESPEELMEVKGIGAGIFEKLKDYITVA